MKEVLRKLGGVVYAVCSKLASIILVVLVYSIAEKLLGEGFVYCRMVFVMMFSSMKVGKMIKNALDKVLTGKDISDCQNLAEKVFFVEFSIIHQMLTGFYALVKKMIEDEKNRIIKERNKI